MSRLKCLPMSSANLSKGITWCLPGSTQCLSSSICLMGWSVSIWAGSQLCLSANVLLWESCWCLPGLSSASACRCLSSELNRCLPRSVSQCLLPNLSRGVTWCLSGSAQCLSLANVCLMGLIGVLSELALTCLSANVCDENPADVCLDWIHLFSCQCLCWWTQSMSA